MNIYLILLNKNNLSYASLITLKRLPSRSKKKSINLYASHSIKYKKHILKNLTFTISSVNHKYPSINEQTKYLFLKHKFGLFKNLSVSSKIVKNQLINLSNFIKFNKFGRRTNLFPKKNKIFFYKKINKLHFRAGRKLFTSFIKIKKNYTQTFLSKRIYSTIKGDLLQQLQPQSLILMLLSTNLFYTYNDINFFVSNLGVWINKKKIYSVDYNLTNFELFSFNWNRNILNFFLKKRQKAIMSLKMIKFYKFRSKIFISKSKNFWAPSSYWINEHIFLYVCKQSNIEFDIRVLKGVFIYNDKITNFNTLLINSDISLFMARSYNWKYIV